MNSKEKKEKSILERIKKLEDYITKGQEYIENGSHADWSGFRAIFNDKVRDGKVLPPHKDWVKKHFIPLQEQELKRKQKALERLYRD
jgi:hypothetical protein